jgi:hypothetical protein
MPRATRQQGRETFSGEDNHGKKRKKVAEEVVEKEGDAPEAPSGIEEERVEVAPTEPTGAATMEDEVVVEKEGDAPEEPLGIKEERVDYPSPCLHPLPNTKALTPLLFLHLFHCKL